MMRVIQIGAGFWGGGWTSVLKESPYTELVALVDLNEQTLHRVGDEVGLPKERRFTNFQEAMKHVEADAALVVTPPPFHESVALEALEAGLHCMVEKPIADTLAGADRIVRKAKEKGLYVMITQSHRFKRGPRTVRRLIQQGAVGKIEALYGRYRKAPMFTGFRAEMDEPLIVDQSIHHFDYIRGIFGLEPDYVRARSFNPSWSYFKSNASAFVEFESKEGTMVSYTGSWVARRPHTQWDGSWEVHGTYASLYWDDNRVLIYPHENVIGDTVFYKGAIERANDILEVPLDNVEEEERYGTLKEFTSSIKEGRQPETYGEDNMRSLNLVLAAVESTKRGGERIDLNEFFRSNIQNGY
ncbi:Gfo/Idh/MocA family oxidoreductase [Cohnella sp. LGH]|uniref:Gfo/Idh/MocA family protein n=1 Tax=Cohnella sp. LGH TaxID=1619153 RepID=UPI001ADC6166|nr:Gfo/Idh/MocA family oxidoreductase [Cohnella sp. LGH]QTH44187.1 Gfo/Idh/MocA family oxidoreductase [Cohnella sp. LGH]